MTRAAMPRLVSEFNEDRHADRAQGDDLATRRWIGVVTGCGAVPR